MALRGLFLVLLGLSLFAGTAAARGDGSANGRRAEARAVVALGAKPDRSPLLRRVSAVHHAAPHPAACPKRGRRGGAAANCRGGGGGAVHTLSWRGWAQGLPPALGVQAQGCPAGTMATLAAGHDDIVRCIPL